jgi:hypothetical protein
VSWERSAGVVRLLRDAGFSIRALDKDGGDRPWADEDLARGAYLLARR